MGDVDALIENKNLSHMLEYETQILLDLLHKDGLVVAAKGISMDMVLLNLFRVYSDPGNLVIVLNCSEFEEKYLVEKLNDPNVHTTTYTTNITDREITYLEGGIHFVTTRILVVDMLKKRIPIDKITGFIVLRAHSILESCQEAFVLRLFRQHNKTGFIKGFSNCAESFSVGFGHVERVMRTLFVKELYIWPRFHSLIVHTLKKHEPQVIELHVPISDVMSKIQTDLLDLMNLTVKELKQINKTIEMQEITVENCLTKKFHKILQNQLDCIWHQLSQKTKQLIADLKTLRHLMVLLLYSDPISFYTSLMTYRTMEYAKHSFWVLLKPAELLFTHANQLIFTGDKELNPEMCPKWKILLEILTIEIPNEIRKENYEEKTVLLLCQDNRTCAQLKRFLTRGGKSFLFHQALSKDLKFTKISKEFDNNAHFQEILSQKEVIPKKKCKTEESETQEGEEEECMKNSYILTMSQTISSETNQDQSISENDITFECCPEMENLDLTQIINQPKVLIQTFKTADSFLSLQKTLCDVKPRFIIMYQSNATAVRQIELYEARRMKNKPLKTYFLIHAETVEEQSYLTSLRREKEAFEFLIETKSKMVIPEDQDGKSDDCMALQREMRNSEISTRKGGVQQPNQVKQIVIVDMREFRSELPALIHKRGIEIEPVTITVGDYIITKDICVERKSLSDLVGSLNSGRLFQQCTQMSRFYTKPMLLIEFDQNKPFAWQSNYMVSNDANSFDIQQKLLLLTLHFPKLKLIWSPSPYASAQLFEELKEGKEQPDVQYAAAISNEQNLDTIETKYNTNLYDFVQKLPGITSKNIDSFLRKYKNFGEVLLQTEDALKEGLGNSTDAQALYSILHEEHTLSHNPEEGISKTKLRNKFKYTRGKK